MAGARIAYNTLMLRSWSVVALLFLLPAPVSAWGFDAHRFIMREAIDQLPPEIRPFFLQHRDFIVEHTIDPDLWRTAGWEEEGPRHFFNLDAYGEYPFRDLPRDYDVAVGVFGRDTVHRHGLLPWRAEQMWLRLVGAFEAHAARRSPYALEDVKAFASWLAHYVGDAHVPFHALLNYDGQLSGQRGIHSRFETELFRRYRSVLTLPPVVVVPVTRPRDAVFDALLVSFRQAGAVLDADRRAADGRTVYGNAYFDRFHQEAGEVLARRLADSIGAVAGFIAGAWHEAGRPVLPAGR